MNSNEIRGTRLGYFDSNDAAYLARILAEIAAQLADLNEHLNSITRSNDGLIVKAQQ